MRKRDFVSLGTSPTNSYAVESVFFDEVNPQKIIVQELTTPETLKLDLLIQTKTLSEKVKKSDFVLWFHRFHFRR